MRLLSRHIVLSVLILGGFLVDLYGQQDPQYTQYMYNTMSVNPAYAGQRDVLSITGLYRNQWVGVEGSPVTQTLGVHGPLRNDRLGVGFSIINDALGPAQETYIQANFSYTLPIGVTNKLSFGLSGGAHNLSTDWSKGTREDEGDPLFGQNVNLWAPLIGAGIYLHSERWYIGLSVPNFIKTNHYRNKKGDDSQGFKISTATERLHFYGILGYVFDVNENLKLKPAGLFKAVSGAPVIADVSLNALIQERFTLGASWRWDSSVSGMAGFQVNKNIYIGYSYDATTNELRNYSRGTHEIMLRFELEPLGRLLSPRFF